MIFICLSYLRTDRPCRSTEVSQPASLRRDSLVTSDIPYNTFCWKRGITDRRTDGSFRHTVVSTPTSSIGSHVTDNFSFHALNRCWAMARRRTEGSLRHAVVSTPTSSIGSHVTDNFSFHALRRWR